MSNPQPHCPRILVVDDDQAQLTILSTWLTSTGFVSVTANDGFEAVALLQEGRFDAVVTDLSMARLDGLRLLSIIKELDADLPVIFLSGQGTLADVIEALHQGRAFDFLQKPMRDLRQLNAVIERALSHGRRAAAAVAEPAETVPAPKASAPMPAEIVTTADFPPHLEPLTATELKLVSYLSGGLDNRRIAAEMHLGEKTVRNYLSRIYEKLHVGSRLQAVALCQQHGLLARQPGLASAA